VATVDKRRRRLPLSVNDLAHACGLLGFALLLVIPLAYDAHLVQVMLRIQMNDFGKFYYTARYFLEGRDPYAASPATLILASALEGRQLGNMNPPHFHLLILPLSLWGPQVALVGWTIASVVSLALAVRVLVENLGCSRLTPWRLGFILLFFVAWVGTGSLIVTGQLSWLLLWPLTASWAAMRQGRWLKAGILVGLLVSVKPFLALLLVYFVIRRRLDALVAGLLALALAYLVGLAVFGYAAHMSWLRALGGVDWSWLVMNGSLLGFFSRLLSPCPGLAPLVEASGAIYALWLLTSAGGVTLTLLSVAQQRGDVDRAFALLLVASLLFSPLGWVYYAWFLIPPLLAIGGRALLARQRAFLVPAVVASLWPVPLAVVGQPSALATFTVGSIYFWGFLSLWIALLRDSPKPDRDVFSTRVTAG